MPTGRTLRSEEIAPQISPCAVTLSAAVRIVGVDRGGHDALQADDAVGADAGFEFVLAPEPFRVAVRHHPQDGAAADEGEPLQFDGHVVEAEQCGDER